jgi:ATP-dependent helicase HrpB
MPVPGLATRRVIILSTDIFETSVTIPGIILVLDSGRQKRTSLMDDGLSTKLGTELASQSAARQRRGCKCTTKSWCTR